MNCNCLFHYCFKTCYTLKSLLPVFFNISGKPETTIWSKTCVENEDGDKKSEIFQCVLPRYKEKKVLTTYSLAARKPKPYHLSDEAILSKEDGKDGEVLVVYKPREASSAVYKLVAPNDKYVMCKCYFSRVIRVPRLGQWHGD